MKKLFTMKGIVIIGVIVLLGTTTIAGTTLREAFAPNNGRAAIPAATHDHRPSKWPLHKQYSFQDLRMPRSPFRTLRGIQIAVHKKKDGVLEKIETRRPSRR